MDERFNFDLQLFAEGEDTPPDGGQVTDTPADNGDKPAEGEGLLSGGNKPAAGGDGLLSGNDKTAESEEDKSNDKPAGAPEKYEDFKFPEGTEVNQEDVASFQGIAKELNLSQENAQKLVDFQSNMVQGQLKQYDDASNKQANDWKAETLKAYDQQEVSDAVRAFKAAPPEFQKLLTDYRLENNKAVVGYFASIGKSMHEDTFAGGNNQNTSKSAAEILYPDLAK